MSILEEGTVSAIMPMMGYSTILCVRSARPADRVESIVSDLATRWSWSEDGTEPTFALRSGIKWHDGKVLGAARPQFYENYSCRSTRNLTGYCNPEVEAMIDKQSSEGNPARRKELVWQIERKLIEDAVRPIIYFMGQATFWQPEVKGLTLMDNSIFNSWRMEDVWLDRKQPSAVAKVSQKPV
jgi:ABC-type transport system substrate-binding protein